MADTRPSERAVGCIRLLSADERRARIATVRQAQPIEVLARKRRIARRKGIWTQEDIDWFRAEGARY